MLTSDIFRVQILTAQFMYMYDENGDKYGQTLTTRYFYNAWT